MEVAKNSKMGTPVKDPEGKSQSKTPKISKLSENSNPNVSHSSSPLTKSSKSQKCCAKNPVVVYSPRNKLRERKFVVAKKNLKKERSDSNPTVAVDCKCKDKFGGNSKKCLCVAYENLRASQEEFFKSKAEIEAEEEAEEKNVFVENVSEGYGSDNQEIDQIENSSGLGISAVKRRRDKLMKEARNSVPEFGKVMHLVKAFEKLLSIPNSKESEEEKDDETEPKEEKNDNNKENLVKAFEKLLSIPNSKESEEEKDDETEPKEEKNDNNKEKPMKWSLPGLQPPKVLTENEDETKDSSSSYCLSDFVLTAESLGLDRRFSGSSSGSSRGSISSRISNEGRRSRRNSSDSTGRKGGRRCRKMQLKPTSQKPFKLRTEQRGKVKEEEFEKKIQEMMAEEEKQRIPIAQGLPWTTDEPVVLIKPTVKEYTIPIDLRLHSDVRAEERAEFDHQIAEKMRLIEQYKMERERQQKMAEEEEIKRLRKELIPKAQPLPYFDRPFVPRRSSKNPTVPREPKFHIPQHKKIKSCCSSSTSWNDMSTEDYCCLHFCKGMNE